MKAFKIISEFRIQDPQKVSLKILYLADSYGFFDLISFYLNTIDRLNMKLLIYIGILQDLRFDCQKFRILEKFELSPMLEVDDTSR